MAAGKGLSTSFPKCVSNLPNTTRPDVEVQRATLSEDGIWKKSGLLLDKYTTIDGKPVFPGKHKKIKTPEETWVRSGTMIFQQKRLVYHPGFNVGIGRDLTLFALEDGVVYITNEKFTFNWNQSLVRRFYFDQQNMNIYKMYYHVITTEQSKNFKLVSQI